MNLIEAALHQIAADLNSRRQQWALVDGFAVSARAEPRCTRDVDVAVAVPDDSTAEGLVHSQRVGTSKIEAYPSRTISHRSPFALASFASTVTSGEPSASAVAM